MSLKELKDKKKELEKLKKKIQKECVIFFKKYTKELFAKYPDLKGFGWKQYTPYFNDGEVCTFSSYKDEPDILFSKELQDKISECYKAANDDIEQDEDGWYEGYDFPNGTYWNYAEGKSKKYSNYPEIANKIIEEVVKFLETFDDEDLEFMFGDHIKVRVTRKGVTKETYKHD